MFDKLSEKMGVFANILNSNKYLTVIKDSFSSVIPLIIVGSIGTLISSIVCSTSNGLARFAGFEWLAGYAPLFDTVNYATMNILGLLIAYCIGKNLAKQHGMEGHFEGCVSVCAFICAAPNTLVKVVGEETVKMSGIGVDVTNSKGLFVAMIVGMIAMEIYCRLSRIDKLKVKMPDSVPPNVASSFSALIPTIIVLFGVATIVNGVINPIVIAALQTNSDLVLAGQEATEIVTKPFWTMYITMGGFGCTIGLLLAIFIASKREDDRSIAKIGLAPGLFGVNEPLIFGLPIVLNPILGIPFILAPMTCALVGYVATWMGFAAKAYIMIPWCLPPVISGFLATGGHIGTVITQIICIAVSTLIYLPFVKMRNKEIAR